MNVDQKKILDSLHESASGAAEQTRSVTVIIVNVVLVLLVLSFSGLYIWQSQTTMPRTELQSFIKSRGTTTPGDVLKKCKAMEQKIITLQHDLAEAKIIIAETRNLSLANKEMSSANRRIADLWLQKQMKRDKDVTPVEK
ncbi:MAG TPA: hypothetical protein VMW36_03170 [Patescibacteria group bacterium]|nr:hypothetical protein [Patescibacteria group bacterium]